MQFKLTKRDIKSPKLILKLEIELLESTLTPEEAAQAVENQINYSQSREFSELIVFLLRTTKSSMWELKNLEIV